MTTKTQTALRETIEHELRSTPSGRISPIIVARSFGVGTSTDIKAVAADMGLRTFELRVAMLNPHDFDDLPVLDGGVLQHRKPALDIVRNVLSEGSDVMLVLDEALANGAKVTTAILNQVQDQARGRVIVMLIIAASQREMAEEAVRAMRMPTALIQKFTTVDIDEAAMLEGYLCYARKSGIDADVIAYLDENGLGGRTPKAWTFFSNMLQSDETQRQASNIVEALYIGAIGAEQVEAFTRWKAAKAA